MKLAGGSYSAARRGGGAPEPFPVNNAISFANWTGFGARGARFCGAGAGAGAGAGSGVIAFTMGFFFDKYSSS